MTCPSFGFNNPPTTSAIAACPLPDTPARPTICPPFRANETDFKPGTLPTSAVVTFRKASKGASGFAGETSGGVASVPIIISASAFLSVSFVFTPPAIFPCRKTTTRSAIAITSCNLCEMKMIESPSAMASLRVANRSSVSCGVKTAVGSSRIRIRTSRYSALRISTLWRSPNESVPTRASGETAR